jgi:hypothetical protein
MKVIKKLPTYFDLNWKPPGDQLKYCIKGKGTDLKAQRRELEV